MAGREVVKITKYPCLIGNRGKLFVKSLSQAASVRHAITEKRCPVSTPPGDLFQPLKHCRDEWVSTSNTAQIKHLLLSQDYDMSHRPLYSTQQDCQIGCMTSIALSAVTPRSAELIYSLRLTIIILCFIFFQIMFRVVFNEKNSSNSFWAYLIIGGLSVSLIEEGLWETEVEISQHWGFWSRPQTNYTPQKTSLRLP